MKKFSEIEIPKIDSIVKGKRFFDGQLVRMRDLKDKTITVTDFEDDCSTKYGNKMFVKFTFKSGTEAKFCTGDRVIKGYIYKLKELNEIPFITTIRFKMEDDRERYYFT